MAKPFDAATKRLVESGPTGWLAYAGLQGEQAELVDADLTTITSEADRILRVHNPDYLAHLELQVSYVKEYGDAVLRYNALACTRYHLPVQSVIILLRKEADGPGMSGVVHYPVPGGEGELYFRYKVVRVWEKSVDEVLAGDLATLPLAPLADVSLEEAPNVIRRMEERIAREASRDEASMYWTATLLLLGLRFKRETVISLLKGVQGLKESDTYLMILEEGEARGEARGELNGERKLLIRQGEKRFGAPDEQTLSTLEAIDSPEALMDLGLRLLEVESWKELLG